MRPPLITAVLEVTGALAIAGAAFLLGGIPAGLGVIGVACLLAAWNRERS